MSQPKPKSPLTSMPASPTTATATATATSTAESAYNDFFDADCGRRLALFMLMLYALAWPERDEGKAVGKGVGGLHAGQACGGHSGCKLRVASCYLLVGWQQKQLPFCCVWHATVRQVVVVAPADTAVAAGGKLK